MTRAEELKALFEKVEKPYRLVIDSQIDELLYTEEKLKELKRLPFIMVNGKGESRPTANAKQYKEFSQIRDSIIRNLVKIIEKHSEKEKGAFEEWLAKQNF